MNNNFYLGIIVGFFISGILMIWSSSPDTSVPLNTIEVGNKICKNHKGLSNIQVDRESYFIRCKDSYNIITLKINNAKYFMDKK